MSRDVMVPPHLREQQRQAGDPQSSVWVSANAGSGKTYVLTQRVVRLLLAGVAPDQILCLTYTKAAAAEMRKRVAQLLGSWAIADEPALARLITETEGTPPDADALNRARTLFAHALETPGGLKIMTIHAFAESVLHRFPREAGIPFDFTTIEDNVQARLIAEERAAVLAELGGDDGLSAAIATLFAQMSDFQIGEAISDALANQRVLRHVLADLPRTKSWLRNALGGAARPVAAVKEETRNNITLTASHLADLRSLPDPSSSEATLLERLAGYSDNNRDVEILTRALLTDKGTARAKFLTRDKQALRPGLEDALRNEAMRLEAMRADLVAAELLERSEALLDVLAAIVRRYEQRKRAQSLLDFDDLIVALTRLLADPALGAWVSYKLDAGITHILVDEGQDTNPEQWDLIRLLAADFFDGDSAAQRLRTLFAVGDRKQSIYSFQGADPTIFVSMETEFGVRIRTAGMLFNRVDIRTSFRTLPEVLAAVDLTFAQPTLRSGVLADDEPVLHESARRGNGGRVVLWPPLQDEPPATDTGEWATTPPTTKQGAQRRLAQHIARTVKGWIAAGRPLPGRNRAITADDVLVLVQTRGPQFHEIIRALVQAGLPTPGADRLAITTHIAVLDLMALGDVLLNPADDLQLAALLRSPLFAVSEADLFALAQPRSSGTTLWSALETSTLPAAADAAQKLRAWRSRLDFDRPYHLFADVLYREGGLRAFHARLGREVDDVLAEFLDLALSHEQAAQPSLQGFLASLRQSEVTIRRELGESGTGVRVMTVHGAKGLEAPIVILADAASTEERRAGASVFMRGGETPFFFHAGSRAQHVTATDEIRVEWSAFAAQEYWRKLYVGMTRAEDELYVTGALTPSGKLDGSWYEAIDAALRPEASIATDMAGNETALIYPAAATDPAPAAAAPAAGPPPAPPALPSLPPVTLRRIVRPSTAFAAEDGLAALDTRAAEAALPRDPDEARRAGVALHALLQHLARLAPGDRPAIAAGAITGLLPDKPALHAPLVAKALSILARPDLAPFFGPESRAELPILAHARRGAEKLLIAGRIDRLMVTPDSVHIVDFKSDARPPSGPEVVPPAYLRQLGLYALVAGQLFPGRSVRASLLWTELESLMNLSESLILSAVEGITLG